MRLRLGAVVAAAFAASVTAEAQRTSPPTRLDAPAAYQGSGQQQNGRFSRTVRLGRDGRFSLSNIAGEIVITGGSSENVEIEAVKRSRGSQRDLDEVVIEVDARAGRVDVRTVYPRRRGPDVSVSYTVMLPAAASVDVHSISGNVRVTSVQGTVRADSISGNVSTAGTPRLELAKSVSGNIDLADAGSDAELAATSISGNIRARGVKARSIDASTVSGDVQLIDVACERIGARSTSGSIEYSGTLARNGRYDFNSHSGDVRLTLSDAVGFDLTANTFSGTIRSDLPLVIGGIGRNQRGRGPGGINQRSVEATFGDGSAAITARSFSGNVVISKR